MSVNSYIKSKRKEKVFSIAQKKAHLLFEQINVDYIPIENVQSVRYSNGTYYINLRSDGVLLLKLNSIGKII